MLQSLKQRLKVVKCPTLADCSVPARVLPKVGGKETQIQISQMGERSHLHGKNPIWEDEEIDENLMIQTSHSLELGTHHARAHGSLHQMSSPLVELEPIHFYECVSATDREPPLHDSFLFLELARLHMNGNSAIL